MFGSLRTRSHPARTTPYTVTDLDLDFEIALGEQLLEVESTHVDLLPVASSGSIGDNHCAFGVILGPNITIDLTVDTDSHHDHGNADNDCDDPECLVASDRWDGMADWDEVSLYSVEHNTPTNVHVSSDACPVTPDVMPFECSSPVTPRDAFLQYDLADEETAAATDGDDEPQSPSIDDAASASDNAAHGASPSPAPDDDATVTAPVLTESSGSRL